MRTVEPHGGLVYHDVTERHWAQKGVDCGVHGLIAVNNRAGGHAGPLSPEALIEELAGFGRPVICAGGVSTAQHYRRALELGYAGVQMGTAFIATEECTASDAYKRAIIEAEEGDIVLSERITGVPVSVIKTPFIERMGLKAGPIARWMLRGRRRKHLMRTIYALKSLWQLKRSHTDQSGRTEYWQAGKSVAGINRVRTVEALVRNLTGTPVSSAAAPEH